MQGLTQFQSEKQLTWGAPTILVRATVDEAAQLEDDESRRIVPERFHSIIDVFSESKSQNLPPNLAFLSLERILPRN